MLTTAGFKDESGLFIVILFNNSNTCSGVLILYSCGKSPRSLFLILMSYYVPSAASALHPYLSEIQWVISID